VRTGSVGVSGERRVLLSGRLRGDSNPMSSLLKPGQHGEASDKYLGRNVRGMRNTLRVKRDYYVSGRCTVVSVILEVGSDSTGLFAGAVRILRVPGTKRGQLAQSHLRAKDAEKCQCREWPLHFCQDFFQL
jgi:hypothetical protein